jgi:glycosyltransferase involved in cell wall biosynthesis
MPFQPQVSPDLEFSTTFKEIVDVPCASLSAIVVDPLAFSPAYNYSLCDAMSRAGCSVTLAQGGMRRPQLSGKGSFELWSDFHPPDQISWPRKAARQWLKRGRERRLTHTSNQVVPNQSPPAETARPGAVRKLIKAADYFAGMRHFASVFESKRPDIIHFQWLTLPVVDRLYLSRLRKISPLVLTLHNTTLFHGSPTSRLQGVGFASVLSYFDALIVHTEFSRRRVIEMGWCRPENVHVVPHGVLECHDLPTNVSSTASADGEQTILFFGSVRPYKGIDYLIRALAKLPAGLLASTRLVVAGNPGMDTSKLFDLAQSLGVDHRITWHLRFIRDEEIPEFFHRASLIVLPYREIDQSGVLMTAVAFGKPIVASRIGGIPEVVHDGIHGYLVDVGDVDGLATAVSKVLLDREKREDMQKALAQLRTGPLAWSSCASRTIDLYQQVLRSAQTK